MSLKLNIHEPQAHLSKYLKILSRGGRITLCKRNVPIAVILGIPSRKQRKVQLGFAKGRFSVKSAFFEPLSEEMLSSFEGE